MGRFKSEVERKFRVPADADIEKIIDAASKQVRKAGLRITGTSTSSRGNSYWDTECAPGNPLFDIYATGATLRVVANGRRNRLDQKYGPTTNRFEYLMALSGMPSSAEIGDYLQDEISGLWSPAKGRRLWPSLYTHGTHPKIRVAGLGLIEIKGDYLRPAGTPFELKELEMELKSGAGNPKILRSFQKFADDVGRRLGLEEVIEPKYQTLIQLVAPHRGWEAPPVEYLTQPRAA